MTPRLSLSSKILFPKNKVTAKRRLKNLLEEGHPPGGGPRDIPLSSGMKRYEPIIHLSKSRLNCA
jgi:hypothetical protein